MITLLYLLAFAQLVTLCFMVCIVVELRKVTAVIRQEMDHFEVLIKQRINAFLDVFRRSKQ